MKKILTLLLLCFCITTAFSQGVFVYDENGTPSYYVENPNVKYVEFSSDLSDIDFDAAKTTLFQYADTIQNLEDRLFRIYVNTSSLTSFETAKNTLTDEILYCSNSLRIDNTSDFDMWITNKLFLKIHDNEDIETVLSTSLVPYISVQQMNPSVKEYLVTLENQTNAITYANTLYNSGSAYYSVPDFSILSNESFVPTPDNNSGFNEQWGLRNVGQKGGVPGMDINADSAWTLSSGSGIVVATLNDGVDLYHTDLSGNLLTGYDACGRYNNGMYDLTYTSRNAGTAIAGVIAAEDNNMGAVGVAPNAKIMPIRIYNYFGHVLRQSRIVSGINYAYQNGADIIDMAVFYAPIVLGDPSSLPLRNAIDKATTLGRNGKGCVVIAGSGNRCTNTSFPANYEKVLAVGGIDRFGIRSGSSQCIVTTAQCEPWATNVGGSCFGTYLDVMAPGTNIYSSSPNSFEGEYYGTQFSSAFVSGIAALMLSKNNNLTEQEVRDIIRITARKISTHVYTYNPNYPYGDWNPRMGYGFVNSFQSIKKASDYILYTKDNSNDVGNQPFYKSNYDTPDIWIRRNKDGGLTHQNAYRGDTNYVYVRIHNKGSIVSPSGDSLMIYAKKIVNNPRPSLHYDTWPNNWDRLGCVEVSNVPINGERIFCVPVYFLPIHNEYAILSIIDTTLNNQIFSSLTTHTTYNVDWYNKISLKNSIIIDNLVTAGNHGLDANFTVPSINNALTGSKLRLDLGYGTSNILDNAEVTLIFPMDLMTDWTPVAENIKQLTANTFLVTGETVELSDVPETDVTLRYNFLTRRNEPEEIYKNHITQYVGEDEELVGGLTIQIEKPERAAEDRFRANAGNDTAVLLNTTATLHATQINENATYRWYDKERNFKYEGLNYSTTPSQTTSYILEVTAESDGYRDLDTVKVTVVPGCIRSITPNPVEGNWVTVGYEYATTVTSAQLLIYNTATTTLVGNYDLSNMDNVSSLDIEVTNYPTGSYTVVLVCDNAVCHSKVLIRQ